MGKGDSRHGFVPPEDVNPNEDIEQMPTPADPNKQDYERRMEVNARSLCMLCQDMPLFMTKAEKEYVNDISERSAENIENIKDYFNRIRDLLARIINDLNGNEYGSSLNIRPRIFAVSMETSKYIRSSLVAIEKGLSRINLSTFSELPFGHSLYGVDEEFDVLRKIFR